MGKLLLSAKNSICQPQFNVSVLSHHIPKAAGSSPIATSEQAFGTINVYVFYANIGASAMSKGEQIWLPFKATVLHGHFKPHINHTRTFPNTIKAVWIRAPLERIWLLVKHLLVLKDKHSRYVLMKKRLPESSLKSQESIVKELLLNYLIEAFTRTYSRFFNTIPIGDFNLVGSKHKYEKGVEQLCDSAGLKLKALQVNRRTSQTYQLPSNIKRLELHLLHEYEIVGDFL
jgi:hypothetical protein